MKPRALGFHPFPVSGKEAGFLYITQPQDFLGEPLAAYCKASVRGTAILKDPIPCNGFLLQAKLRQYRKEGRIIMLPPASGGDLQPAKQRVKTHGSGGIQGVGIKGPIPPGKLIDKNQIRPLLYLPLGFHPNNEF